MSWEYHLDKMRRLGSVDRRRYVADLMKVPVLDELTMVPTGERIAMLSKADARELLRRAEQEAQL